MLLWDTGEYEILAYRDAPSPTGTDDELDASLPSNPPTSTTQPSEPEKLHRAFQKRKIKIRLHGTRLPATYTISLRLTQDNFKSTQPLKPSRRRKPKRKPPNTHSQSTASASDTDTPRPSAQPPTLRRSVSSLHRHASPPAPTPTTLTSDDAAITAASDSEDASIRVNNAYTGATNSINSIHQRKWFLSLDRPTSGFTPTNQKVYGNRVWVRRPKKESDSSGSGGASGASLDGFEPFHVLGRDVERSIVSGRLAKDVLEDEGVEGYTSRGGWKAVTE